MVIKSTSVYIEQQATKPAKYQQQTKDFYLAFLLKINMNSSMCSGNHLCNLYPVQFVDGWEVSLKLCFFAICLQQVFFVSCVITTRIEQQSVFWDIRIL